MLDLRSKRSGKLIAMSPTTQRSGTRILWDTVCECGRHRLVAAQLFASRYTTSCEDCANARKGPRKHGLSNGPEWIVWRSILARCYNPSNASYRWYGARGIRVCDRWNPKAGGSFTNFLADRGLRPEGTTLGRFMDSGDYTPENTRWQTRAQQTEEQRRKRAHLANQRRMVFQPHGNCSPTFDILMCGATSSSPCAKENLPAAWSAGTTGFWSERERERSRCVRDKRPAVKRRTP
jgi:hypothetical protein